MGTIRGPSTASLNRLPNTLTKTMVVDLDQVMEESKQALAAFQERIAEQEEVMECYLMNGDSDDPIRGI